MLTSCDGQTITSDAIGNITGNGTWSYTWQHGRQLASATDGTTNVTYTYDADGRRIQKMVNGTATKYAYIGSTLVHMTSGGNTLHFRYDSSGPMSVNYNGTEYYYIKNAQGDITGIVDTAGNVVAEYTYNAWGSVLSTTGSMANTLGALNPFRYRGYVYDAETGLYYLKTRYYNPVMGRFLCADTYASTGIGLIGTNAFAYCNNNPAMMKDGDGSRPLVGMSPSTETKDERDASFKYMKTSKASTGATDKVDPKVPPPPSSGYKPPKKNPTPGKVKNPNGSGKGWPSNDGGVWVPDNTQHGGPGWVEQFPDGSHRHRYPDGHIRGITNTNWDFVLGGALILTATIGIIWVVANDVTVVGIADDWTLIGLAAMFEKGYSVIF